MLNRYTAAGRLSADPELKYTAAQTAVLSFTIAVERDYKTANGKRPVDFIPCVAWNSNAEFISRNFYKGQKIIIDGKLQSRKWQTQDGQNRTVLEVNIDSVDFTGNTEKSRTADYTASAVEKFPTIDGFKALKDDDVPF